MRTFLLVGQTGVGKSSFINATFGLPLATIAEFQACTKKVAMYAYGTPSGNVRLIDTPGLAEANKNLDLAYLRKIKNSKEFEKADTTLYLSPLHETRLRSSEIDTLTLLTSELGSQIWKNAWLVLTFAALVSYEKRNEACTARLNQITNCIAEITSFSEPFSGFKNGIMVDNITDNWMPNTVTIDSLLNEN